MTRRGAVTAAGLVLGWVVIAGVATLVEFALVTWLHWSERAADWTTTPLRFLALIGLAHWAARRHGKEHWFGGRRVTDPPSES